MCICVLYVSACADFCLCLITDQYIRTIRLYMHELCVCRRMDTQLKSSMCVRVSVSV